MAGSSRRATAAKPSVVAKVKGIANLSPSGVSEGPCSLQIYLPGETTKKVGLDGARRATGNGTLPISLVLEHSGEVADDVDDTEDEAVLRSHSYV